MGIGTSSNKLGFGKVSREDYTASFEKKDRVDYAAVRLARKNRDKDAIKVTQKDCAAGSIKLYPYTILSNDSVRIIHIHDLKEVTSNQKIMHTKETCEKEGGKDCPYCALAQKDSRIGLPYKRYFIPFVDPRGRRTYNKETKQYDFDVKPYKSYFSMSMTSAEKLRDLQDAEGGDLTNVFLSFRMVDKNLEIDYAKIGTGSKAKTMEITPELKAEYAKLPEPDFADLWGLNEPFVTEVIIDNCTR